MCKRDAKAGQPLLKPERGGLFIEGSSADLVSGRGDGFSILFDMNELFEEYIGRLAMKVFVRGAARAPSSS